MHFIVYPHVVDAVYEPSFGPSLVVPWLLHVNLQVRHGPLA